MYSGSVGLLVMLFPSSVTFRFFIFHSQLSQKIDKVKLVSRIYEQNFTYELKSLLTHLLHPSVFFDNILRLNRLDDC